MPDDQPSKKGPLGLGKTSWAIGGVVVGGAIYLWWRNRQAANAAAVQTSTIPGNEPSGAVSTSTDLGTSSSSPTSLPGWEELVQNWANSLGFDAASTQNALQNYALGNCLTSEQFKIIDQALSIFGQPPSAPFTGLVLCQPVATTPTTPAPPAPVTTPPPSNQSAFDAGIFQALTQQVGQLSSLVGVNASPGQVQGWQQQYAGESGLQQQFDIETQNVGFVTSKLQGSGRPTSAQQLMPAAIALAGGQAAWNALDPFAQQVYLESANVQAYQQGVGAGTVKKVG